jgi:hypothetical protein
LDINEIKETDIWLLYDKGRNYHRRVGIYTDTDRNYRFYEGDQWQGAKLGEIEPVVDNVIKSVVKYKVAVILDNLYAVNYSSMNFENQEYHKAADKLCTMLNGYAARVWERDKMDFKGRRIVFASCINGEGIIYVNFDKDKMFPVNEIVKKNDVYYGNENDDDIQSQPYILIRKRMPVVNAIEFALNEGMSQDKIEYIIGDNDTFEESGDAAKEEVDNQVTIVYKMYKQDGTVHFSVATRWCEIVKDVDTGLSLYPIAHFNWEETEGSARNSGEVKWLIPNQIEINKLAVRRLLSGKLQAFPRTVVDISKITNPNAINTVGGIIKTHGQAVDDVNKIIGVIPPATMSPDVKELYESLIQKTRDLAGAGDAAVGQIDVEQASGRAILAVQQAAQAPLSIQKENFKNFIEDLARIWLEYLIVYSADGVNLEEKVTDPSTGEEVIRMVKVPQTMLEQLQATVKIDVTPKGVYDKLAQEQTIENLFTQGLFSVQRLPEFEAYVEALDDDSVAPKMKLKAILDRMKKAQIQIAQMEAQQQMMQMNANDFLFGDIDDQAQQIADAEMQMAQNASTDENIAEEDEESTEEVEEPIEE